MEIVKKVSIIMGIIFFSISLFIVFITASISLMLGNFRTEENTTIEIEEITMLLPYQSQSYHFSLPVIT